MSSTPRRFNRLKVGAGEAAKLIGTLAGAGVDAFNRRSQASEDAQTARQQQSIAEYRAWLGRFQEKHKQTAQTAYWNTALGISGAMMNLYNVNLPIGDIYFPKLPYPTQFAVVVVVNIARPDLAQLIQYHREGIGTYLGGFLELNVLRFTVTVFEKGVQVTVHVQS